LKANLIIIAIRMSNLANFYTFVYGYFSVVSWQSGLHLMPYHQKRF